jgi:hypothetical protein
MYRSHVLDLVFAEIPDPLTIYNTGHCALAKITMSIWSIPALIE